MAYGTRYLRLAQGDPGLFSGIVKAVAKVASPLTKVVGGISKIPIVGGIASKVAGIGLRGVPILGQALTIGSLAGMASKTALGQRVIAGARGALGGIGSKVTRGRLDLGGGQSFGPSRPGMGPVAAGGAAALGVATAGVLGSPSGSKRPKTSPQGKRKKRGGGASAARKTRCGCKKGTRHVCFKTGGKRKSKGSGGVSAKQRAARARFAKAAKRGRIKKGAKL